MVEDSGFGALGFEASCAEVMNLRRLGLSLKLGMRWGFMACRGLPLDAITLKPFCSHGSSLYDTNHFWKGDLTSPTRR